MAKGLTRQQAAYAKARASGMEPKAAGIHAGYAAAGVHVTVCRLDKRADIQAEIRRIQGGQTDSVETGDERDKWAMKPYYASPLDLLDDVMNNPNAPKSLRYMAAKDALPYRHARKEGGKKDEQQERAKKAAGGKFQTAARPSHLRAVK